jgi:hypothetical protein
MVINLKHENSTNVTLHHQVIDKIIVKKTTTDGYATFSMVVWIII